MGNLSKHFSDWEFQCKCGECELVDIDKKLLDVLEDLREWFNEPVTITSGYRCCSHNTTVGGAKNSKHVLGCAADIKVKNVHPEQVYEYLEGKYPLTFGLGLYKSWVHVDTRYRKARW